MSRNTKVQQITSKSGIPLKYKKFNDTITSTMQLMRQEVPLLNAYNLKQIEKDNILKLEEQTTKEIN